MLFTVSFWRQKTFIKKLVFLQNANVTACPFMMRPLFLRPGASGTQATNSIDIRRRTFIAFKNDTYFEVKKTWL